MSSTSYDKNTASVNIDTHQTDTGRLNQSQYIIIDIEILKSMFNLVGLCPECKGEHVDFIVNNEKKKGLSTMILLSCTDCPWANEFYSSKKITCVTSSVNKSYDISIRSVIAMREIDRGYSSLEKLCGILDLQPPVNENVFSEIQNKLKTSYADVAQESMNNAIVNSLRKM